MFLSFDDGLQSKKQPFRRVEAGIAHAFLVHFFSSAGTNPNKHGWKPYEKLPTKTPATRDEQKNELFQTWLISQSENLLPPKKGSFQHVYFKSCLFHLHSPLVWDFWPTGCSHVVGRKYPGAAWWHHWVAHLPREIVPVELSGRWASQWLGTRLFKKLRQNTKKANQGSNGQHIKQKKSHIFILHIILRTLNLPHFHRGSFSNDFMVSWGAPSDQLLFSTRKTRQTRQTTCGADRCVAQWTARLAPVAAFGVGNHNHPWVICWCWLPGVNQQTWFKQQK